MDEVYTYESESNTIPSNQNLKQAIYKIYDQKNKLLTNKNISMRKLQIFFNIDIEPICQNKWNVYFNKKIAVEKNMDELAYKSSNKKSKPVKLENYT
jgi:hypothetical protein